MHKLPILSAALRLTLCVAISVALCVAAAAAPARADSTTIHPDKDNTLIQTTTGSLSNGLGDIYVGRTNDVDSAARRRGVIHFDVAGAIPAGSTITGVTLRLFLAKTGDTTARTVSVFRATASWGEGTSYANGGVGAASTTGDATWIHRLFSTTFWTAAGGDRVTTASASASVGPSSAAGQYVTWSAAALVADVQGWLTSPSSNFGWELLGDEAHNATTRRFTSREAVDDPGAHVPELVITYTPPGLAAATPLAPATATARIAGLRVLGARDPDGDGVLDLVLRDDERGVLLGGRAIPAGLESWPLALDRESDDPLAIALPH